MDVAVKTSFFGTEASHGLFSLDEEEDDAEESTDQNVHNCLKPDQEEIQGPELLNREDCDEAVQVDRNRHKRQWQLKYHRNSLWFEAK